MPWIAFSTERRQGDTRRPGALSRLLRERKLPTQAARAQQVHGDRVRAIKGKRPRSLGTDIQGVDGLLTDVAELPLAIFTADCVPVFVANEKAGVVGVLHAGWRGARAGILRQAARLIRKKWRARPSDNHFWFGPSIGPCCFEVRWDVARHFPRARRRKGATWRVDLVGELVRQGRQLGWSYSKERNQTDCTLHNKRYYSYRRSPDPERQVSVIVKRTQE